MLQVPEIESARRIDPRLYEALKKIIGAINALGMRTGVDPHGTIATPPAPASISVSAADGIFDIAVVDSSGPMHGINYFVESATNPGFLSPTVYDLGATRNARIQLGNQTLYWRAYSQYLGSNPSPPVVYGGKTPIAVTGGGVTGPTPNPPQGSGANPPGSGGGRFGKYSARTGRLECAVMRLRAYRAEDEPALREMHRQQGFTYELPDLADPILITKLVLEDDDGRPVMAALARLTCELYLLAEPKAGTPRERLTRLVALHVAAEQELARRGLDDGTCWVPPQIGKSFGRRLERLGWVRDPWPSYSRKIAL